MPSAARAYFDEALAGGFAYLMGLPALQEPPNETEWLDFKEYRGENHEKSCKEKWSELLSAFANTGGGGVVWGISAKKDPDTKIDRVQEALPFDESEQWAEKLRRWILEATNPPVGGVDSLAFRRRFHGHGGHGRQAAFSFWTSSTPLENARSLGLKRQVRWFALRFLAPSVQS